MSLRYAILGLLAYDELSGYQITKRFERSVGYFWQARSQQIYPELARLEHDAMVTSRLVEQVGRPDKRLYRLTGEGRASLEKWIVTPSTLTLVKDEFLVKVYLYGLVDPAAARQALGVQREQHEQRLAAYRVLAAQMDDCPDRFDERNFGGYLTLIGAVKVEETFLEWCRAADALLQERERRAGA